MATLEENGDIWGINGIKSCFVFSKRTWITDFGSNYLEDNDFPEIDELITSAKREEDLEPVIASIIAEIEENMKKHFPAMYDPKNQEQVQELKRLVMGYVYVKVY